MPPYWPPAWALRRKRISTRSSKSTRKTRWAYLAVPLPSRKIRSQAEPVDGSRPRIYAFPLVLKLRNSTLATPIALVTGAGTGTGKAVTLALLKHGYSVALAGRRLETLKQVIAQ